MSSISVTYKTDGMREPVEVGISYTYTPAVPMLFYSERPEPYFPAEVDVYKVDPPIIDPEEAERFVWDFIEDNG